MKPDTQLAALESIQKTAPRCRDQVFDVIQSRMPVGISSDQIAIALGWPINSISGRVTELRNLGRIKDSGARARTQAARQAILWVVA